MTVRRLCRDGGRRRQGAGERAERVRACGTQQSRDERGTDQPRVRKHHLTSIPLAPIHFTRVMLSTLMMLVLV